MIGNDIVDLALARKESNWKRNGFLNKIFTTKEQLLISNSEDPEVMVWNLWSRKEAAYKIYNRQTQIRGYFPLELKCIYENQNLGTVSINDKLYFTETTIDTDCVYTIAVAQNIIFSSIETISSDITIEKINGIPFIKNKQTQLLKPVSISHHGRFWKGITLCYFLSKKADFF